MMPRTTTTPTSIPSHDMLSSTPRPLERGLSTSGSRWFIASLRSLQLSDERKLSARVPMGACALQLHAIFLERHRLDGRQTRPSLQKQAELSISALNASYGS